MSAPVPIGGDWLEMTDPNTGKKYYANKATSKTQWTYPEELNKSEVTETTTTTTTTTTKAAAATTKTTTDSTDDAWLEKVDPWISQTVTEFEIESEGVQVVSMYDVMSSIPPQKE